MRVTMTFASECYKLVVVIALLRISIWEVRWKTGAFKSRLFLPIWDTPPSHDNHSASGLLLLQELLHNLRSRQNSWALNRTFDLKKLSLQTFDVFQAIHTKLGSLPYDVFNLLREGASLQRKGIALGISIAIVK
ncbi:hypothetical protein ACJX0J_001824 (mitochondrion) [Zea mays]